MVGSGLTAVYFLLLVNRHSLPSRSPQVRINPRVLSPVPLAQQMPAIILSLGILVLGLVPHLLVGLSEATTTGLSQFAVTTISGGLS